MRKGKISRQFKNFSSCPAQTFPKPKVDHSTNAKVLLGLVGAFVQKDEHIK